MLRKRKLKGGDALYTDDNDIVKWRFLRIR